LTRLDLRTAGERELRPAPVFAIGVAGHRSIGIEGEVAGKTEACLASLIGDLSRAFRATIAAESGYFASREPLLRVVTMAADGADLLGARAGLANDSELSLILPYDRAEYRKDFTDAAAATLLDATLSRATTVLELPGTRDEGPRAYERANEFILSHIDVLIAVWDGGRASGRAGTGDIVQAAILARIPVVVVDPTSARPPELMLHPANREFDPPFATDLARRTLTHDLRSLTDDLLLPSRAARRHPGFADLLAEPPRPRLRRLEYNLFLKIFQARPTARMRALAASASGSDSWDGAIKFAQSVDPVFAARLAATAAVSRRIDDLATYYSELYRSSTVTRFLVVVIVTFVAATIGVLSASASRYSLIAQAIVNGIILVDAAYGGYRRWQERWLDYRSIAERMRSLRFLQMLGVIQTEPGSPFLFAAKSWTSWYVERSALALGVLNGHLQQPDLAASQLLATDIIEQIDYHRRVYRVRASLERRLSAAATFALFAASVVGVALFVAILVKGGVQNVGGAAYANVLLSILPATMTALRGYRADADLIRLTERSAMTAAALAAVRRTLSVTPLTLDRVRVAATHVATVTSGELTEWRFVLESRGTRTLHRGAKAWWEKAARVLRRLRAR
jgi:hypothetical protein